MKFRQILMTRLWFFCVMLGSFLAVCTACDDDDEQFSPEEQNYFEENADYLYRRKTEKNENGDLVYTPIPVGKDTILYRVMEKEGDGEKPQMSSRLTMLIQGELISGETFQPQIEIPCTPAQLIPGMAYTLLECAEGETVESIIPASLGYGYVPVGTIPAGSTLIFVFKIKAIDTP
ncbi:FKBP-type peptidyl-prolyl cis-trans isomerase [Parabacteroides sp. PF5-9]|uniref:FKBP-type peptidyl-prolyl cis-trans isomerase n=1 Tax=Parabacteroides sp. PF5-9 TaxID=1742404 RepID=UPI002475DD77|nr:FKBP-type peptidyl-prolyl cis-trans isomerase [Parabacteroides sp. PF5-9]MDH6358569.1 FKBP-type peptidyl-prolyl cis-trans isomerase FkpA [Parabacteroides sp. PF5-9]